MILMEFEYGTLSKYIYQSKTHKTKPLLRSKHRIFMKEFKITCFTFKKKNIKKVSFFMHENAPCSMLTCNDLPVVTFMLKISVIIDLCVYSASKQAIISLRGIYVIMQSALITI